MRTIYLDHTATTPLDPVVFEAMQPYFSGTFGNASSVHWYGRQAKTALEGARETIANAIGAEAGEVFFTSGGTESDNLAIRGVASASGHNGRTHIITSRSEHHAVLDTCESLASHGFEVMFLPVDGFGIVDPSQVESAITPATCLVSIMHANNEVGSISPLREVVEAAHRHGVLVHTDAVQTLGKIPINVKELGVDLLTVSAHKTYGPKGIGALYVKRGTPLDPILGGGGQEWGKRPGPENVPLAVGFAKAAELAVNAMSAESPRLKALRDALEETLMRKLPGIIVNGHPEKRLPHILNTSFDHQKLPLEGEMLVVNMDLQGIAVTSGSACTSGSMQPSHVLLAMGRDPNTAKATLRFSFGKSNTMDDVAYAVEGLLAVVLQMTN